MADPGLFSQVLGLVGQGLSPQEAKAQIEQARLIEMAKMRPEERTYLGVAGAADRFAGGLGRLLGGGQEEDAILNKASAFAAMRNQIDPTDPKSLAAASKQMYQMGYTAQGDMYAKAALEAETKRAKIRLDEASIEAKGAEKLTPEQKNAADIVNKTPGILAGSPQWMAAYKKELERLTAKAEGRPNIKEVGVSADTGEAVYTYQTGNDTPKQVVFKTVDGEQKMVPFVGRVDRTTAKVTATASSKAADAGAEAAAKLDAARLGAAQTAADKAVEQAGVLQQLLQTPQTISGTGANARVAALRVFSTVGLTSPKDTEALSNADKFNSLAGERVLTFIKTLGTNPTDSDREFARTIGPALEKGTKTNQDLVNYLLKRSRETVQAAKSMETHFYNNNYSLKGYESPFMSRLEQSTSASSMSADELAKAAGGKIVNGKFVKD